MKTIVIAKVEKAPRCPECHRETTGISGDALPKAGDWNVCSSCAAVTRYTGDGFETRLALPEELEANAKQIAKEDLDLLRACFAAHARRKGTSA